VSIFPLFPNSFQQESFQDCSSLNSPLLFLLRVGLFNYLSLISRGENQNKTTEELSIPIELYESKGLLEIRKQAQKESEKGVFAQAKDVMDSVLKEEREREVREREKKEMEEKKKEKK